MMIDRRSGIDRAGSEADKQLIGERRSGTDRRVHGATPSGEELALWRIRRVMRDEKGRHLLGVAIGEGHFTIYPDVVRVVEWIEQLAASTKQSEADQKPSLREKNRGSPDFRSDLTRRPVCVSSGHVERRRLLVPLHDIDEQVPARRSDCLKSSSGLRACATTSASGTKRT